MKSKHHKLIRNQLDKLNADRIMYILDDSIYFYQSNYLFNIWIIYPRFILPKKCVKLRLHYHVKTELMKTWHNEVELLNSTNERINIRFVANVIELEKVTYFSLSKNFDLEEMVKILLSIAKELDFKPINLEDSTLVGQELDSILLR